MSVNKSLKNFYEAMSGKSLPNFLVLSHSALPPSFTTKVTLMVFQFSKFTIHYLTMCPL